MSEISKIIIINVFSALREWHKYKFNRYKRGRDICKRRGPAEVLLYSVNLARTGESIEIAYSIISFLLLK